ncbi:MAG: YdcF family protein [Cyanobacteriota bacterium]|nr:YdcF family protein [Cyanobacteriota bacterium]
MGFILSKLLPLGVYPLGLALLLQIAALLGRRRRWSPWLSASAIALLWLPATPLISRQLIWGLEERSVALTPTVIPKADAIVVLGGGLRPSLPPRRTVEVNEGGDRLLTGLRLQRQGKAPLLVFTGGKVKLTAGDPSSSEAASAAALAAALGLPPERMLLLEQPRNTAEEARALGQLAAERRWRSVLLVTSATHLPRAVATFKRLSRVNVVPVACDFQLPARDQRGRLTAASLLEELLPDAEELHLSTVALKEHLGLLVYRLRGWS